MLLLFALFTCLFPAYTQSPPPGQSQANGVWTLRSNSIPNMYTAYNATYSNNATCHIVRDVGDFCPLDGALSYDLLTVGLDQIIGYNPIDLGVMFDPDTTQYLGNNTWRVDYTLNITTYSNATTITFNQQGFRFTDYYEYAPNTTQVIVDYGIQDPAAIKLFALVSGALPPEELCALTFAACGGGQFGIPPLPYLNDTGFSTLSECITFMYGLAGTPANNICPYPTRSNTTNCRAAHMFASFFRPDIHCAHIRPDSAVCVNTCLPACANCDANASCQPVFVNFPNSFTPTYTCQCNNGYVGNGSHCTPKACSYGNCPALWGSYDCSGDNLCKCTETFTPNPTDTTGSNLCTCPAPSQLFWNGNVLECVPKGRCLAGQQWQCTSQSYNDVKCTTYGNNTFTLFNDCLCNYGFGGSWEYPCTCASPKRSFYSNSYSGNICLQPWECQFSWQCGYPLTCHVPTGQQIGSCVNSKKRFITNSTNIPCQFTWQCGYPATCNIKGGEQSGFCAY